MQTKGKMLSFTAQPAWWEMMSQDCLLTGADSGSCSIYALAQCRIFIYSLLMNSGGMIQFLKLGYVMEKDMFKKK